jgi:hypothetical protein
MGYRQEEPPLTVYVKLNELVGALKAFLFCGKGHKERQENNREKKQYSSLFLSSQQRSESTK